MEHPGCVYYRCFPSILLLNVIIEKEYELLTKYFIYSGGGDYYKTMKLISFTSSQGIGSSLKISIPIIDDNIIENVESFLGSISLVTEGERIYISQKESEVFILDNDGKYSICNVF